MATTLSRREENRLTRQAAIVAIARDAFLDHGYAATSMSTIACLLGGSKGTLWAHFRSKEALFDAVLDDLTTAFRQHLEDALRPGRDQHTTLTAFGERFLEKLVTPNALRLHRLVVGEAGRFPEIGRLFFERGPRQVTDALGHYLAGEMAEGRLRDAPPQQAAQQLMALIQATQQRRLWNIAPQPDLAERRESAIVAVDTFLRAYAPDLAAPVVRDA